MGAIVIKIHPQDNVAVAVEPIARGQQIEIEPGHSLSAASDIPANHKLALAQIAAGARVIKYGESIGLARESIEPGEWVHTHNLSPEEV